jgi:hypothetical protein
MQNFDQFVKQGGKGSHGGHGGHGVAEMIKTTLHHQFVNTKKARLIRNRFRF